MAIFGQSPEQQEAKLAGKRQMAFEGALETFWASPVGLARRAYEAGDHVFQYNLDVLDQRAVVMSMVGVRTSPGRLAQSLQLGPWVVASQVVNAVCREGWDLVNGDFTFVTTGQESRDKFMSSGQQVAISGKVLAFYLFRRASDHRQVDSDDELRERVWQQVLEDVT